MNENKLPFGRVALYSMASAGLNILAITLDTWILYFYAPPPDSGRPQYLLLDAMDSSNYQHFSHQILFQSFYNSTHPLPMWPITPVARLLMLSRLLPRPEAVPMLLP